MYIIISLSGTQRVNDHRLRGLPSLWVYVGLRRISIGGNLFYCTHVHDVPLFLLLADSSLSLV